jgi:tetrahydromethanopterin S-methyltransferase subunit D
MRARRRAVPLLVLLAAAVAVPALAQTGGQPYPPPCLESKVTKQDNDRAHQLFLDGKQSLNESSYDAAIALFREAYRLNCSVHGILPILATAYERKGDRGEAVRALEEYLRRVPDASDRETIERRIKNLKDQMGASSAPTATASATGSATAATSSASASASTEPTSSAVPTATATESPPPQQGGHTLAPWIVVAIGGAALATGSVLYVIGAGDVSSAENACPPPNHVCASSDTSDVNKGNNGRHLETAGVIAGSVGLAAVVGGLVWHFVEKPSKEGATASGVRLSPAVAPGYAGLSWGGAF